MALKTICRECRMEYDFHVHRTFKQGKCLKCQREAEAKNRAADELVRGTSGESNNG